MVQIASQEPESIIAGDTSTWSRSFSDYKASDGWVLKYALRGPSSINIVADADGDDFLATVTAAASAAWQAGKYAFIAYVTKGAERYTLAEGYIWIKKNLAITQCAEDELLQLEEHLSAIRAFIATNYKRSSYSIAGRSLTSYSIPDLLLLRNDIQKQVVALRKAEKIRRGMDSGSLIRVRFP